MSAMTQSLVYAAIDAAKTAYAPYSNFHVGAALLLDNGQIVTGSNFENASYGMTLCAETVAISKANSDGQLQAIREIAVAGGLAGHVGTAAEPITPCGRCRQIIKEVADVTEIDIPVHCAHATGYTTFRLSELLPHGFGPANLK
jgi:cytidine deaminase